MFANIAAATASSTAITLALLYIMSSLIGIQTGVLVEPRERGRLIFTRVPEIEELRNDRDLRPEKDDFMPPLLPSNEAPGDTEGIIDVGLPRVGPPPVNKFDGPGVLGLNGPLVSMVRPQPIYPAAALRAGLEGWVLIAFDVLADGTVANIKVIESSDTVFENSARRAAAKFRFKPMVIEGVPQVTTGIQNIFRFQMEK